MATTRLWTIGDIEQLPDDDFRYALIRGELFRMPPPQFRHGRVVMVVGAHLFNFVEEHGLGVITDQSGFVFERDPDTLLGPDLAFVQRARIPAEENAYPSIVPDLVVEVASPSQTGPSIDVKTAIYLAAGVRRVWVIDPARKTVRVLRADGSETLLHAQDTIDGEEVLPGFQLSVARIFA
jgi:Uma2 family endonuclease